MPGGRLTNYRRWPCKRSVDTSPGWFATNGMKIVSLDRIHKLVRDIPDDFNRDFVV